MKRKITPIAFGLSALVLLSTNGLSEDREGAPRAEGDRNAEKQGPRDGEARKEGPRDGDAPKEGPRDGDRPKEGGERDGAKPAEKGNPDPAKGLNTKEGKIFVAYDKDRSGTVTDEEIVAMMEGKQNSSGRREVRKMVDRADKDGDGELNYDEFSWWMRVGRADEDARNR